tara:strand:- start:1318 stop:2097 length:780 start_codon:yes stop_codon:yes gene_type:complete
MDSFTRDVDDLLNQKKTRLQKRVYDVASIKKQVDDNYNNDVDTNTNGCGICRFFSRSAKKAASTPHERLQDALMQMKTRTDELSTKLSSARNQASAMHRAGKRNEALVALRKSKTIEKQYNMSAAATEALEGQIMSLEDAQLQKEITSALSSGVKKVRKNQKGLLTRAEQAVDGATEVKDIADDVAGVFDGLALQNPFDEDDLVQELELMTRGGENDGHVKEECTLLRPSELAALPKVPKISLKHAPAKEEKATLLTAV